MRLPTILTTQPGRDYELLDCGEGEKLERYGQYILRRPDPQALWPKFAPALWERVDAVFQGDRKTPWQKNKELPGSWPVGIAGLKLWVRLSPFKHTGIFPEQAPNWEWLRDLIQKAGRPIKVLNLFGYTGAATLACAQAGASVCHVDGSKTALRWAGKNAELNRLQDKPIRWIPDDVLDFVGREVRRANKYAGLIMDPPAFGHGPEGDVWQIEKDFVKLLDLCAQVLSAKPLFMLLNGYAAGYSALTYTANLARLTGKFGGEVEFGELTIAASHSPNLLPGGIFARWRAEA